MLPLPLPLFKPMLSLTWTQRWHHLELLTPTAPEPILSHKTLCVSLSGCYSELTSFFLIKINKGIKNRPNTMTKWILVSSLLTFLCKKKCERAIELETTVIIFVIKHLSDEVISLKQMANVVWYQESHEQTDCKILSRTESAQIFNPRLNPTMSCLKSDALIILLTSPKTLKFLTAMCGNNDTTAQNLCVSEPSVIFFYWTAPPVDQDHPD